MYHLHVDIGDGLADEIRAYAAAYGISIAAATRILLSNALAAARTP